MITESPSALPLSAQEMADMLSAATQDLFSSMLGIEVELRAEHEDEGDPFDGVLSLIGITGRVVGTGALMCSDAAACDLSARFLMTEFPSVDEQVLDSIGEITNMIVGGFKNLLEAQFGRLQMSIPSVIHGCSISTHKIKADAAVALRCIYAEGEIRLKIGLAASRD